MFRKRTPEEDVKYDFLNEYMFKKPFSEYVNMCNLRNTNKKAKKKGRSPYLYVGLRKELPENLSLPSEYKGLKIISEVIGPITFLSLQ